MGKKERSVNRSSKTKSKAMTYSDISEDEIDRFNNQREKILLADSENEFGSDPSDQEEALMDLPSGSDEAEEYADEDVLYAGDSDAEEKEEKWGKSKKAFYSADKDAGEEEAAEAKKLQKKRLSGMKTEDFTGGKAVSKSGKKSGPVTLDLSDVESESEDQVDEYEQDDDEEDSGSGEFELDQEQLVTLSAEEKIELLSKHSSDFKALVSDFKERLGYLDSTLKPLMTKLKELPTSEGLSFLKVKYQLLTAYCTNVAFYLQLKLKGKGIEGHPVLKKLVKFRLLLEKIKPMENKLRYQVDRLLKAANGQIADEEAEATKFRPNPDMFLKADGNDEEDEDGEAADGRYRAPKLAAVHYPEDDSALARAKKHEHYLRKVNASTRLIQDIKAEFEDAPEEEALDVVYGGKSRRKEQEERDRYEEENYMRFTLDKKAKRKLKEQSKVVDELEDLNDFIEELGGKRSKGNKRSHQQSETFHPAIPEAPSTTKKSKYNRGMVESESDVEDDYYEKVKAAKRAAKNQGNKPSKAPIKFRSHIDLNENSSAARPANYKMLKNKGMVTGRSKEVNNPRVRQRKKFERAEKRLGSFRAVNKTATGKYGGEGSGIRTNIVRSTKF